MKKYGIFLCTLILVGCADLDGLINDTSELPNSTKGLFGQSGNITTAEICKALSENEVAAKRRYKSHTLYVTGKIQRIGEPLFQDYLDKTRDTAYVTLKSGNAIVGAGMGSLGSSIGVSDLKVGQTVTLKGRINGFGTSPCFIHMTNSIVERNKSTTSSKK